MNSRVFHDESQFSHERAHTRRMYRTQKDMTEALLRFPQASLFQRGNRHLVRTHHVDSLLAP